MRAREARGNAWLIWTDKAVICFCGWCVRWRNVAQAQNIFQVIGPTTENSLYLYRILSETWAMVTTTHCCCLPPATFENNYPTKQTESEWNEEDRADKHQEKVLTHRQQRHQQPKRPAATFDDWQAATSSCLSAVRCEFGVNSLTESAGLGDRRFLWCALIKLFNHVLLLLLHLILLLVSSLPACNYCWPLSMFGKR